MTHEATLEKMQAMRLHGMARAFENALNSGLHNNFTPGELTAHLIDSEYDERYNKKLARLLKTAGFRYKAALENIQYSKSRNLDKDLLLGLSNCEWIKKGKNLIITGATGVGKSYIASALGHHACINGYKTLYTSCLKLFSTLKLAKADGSYPKEIKKISKQDLIILDDFGLQKMDTTGRLILLEILEDRNGLKSTIFTSQLPAASWFEIIGDPTIADAICDRLIHTSHTIELKGESMRRKNK